MGGVVSKKSEDRLDQIRNELIRSLGAVSTEDASDEDVDGISDASVPDDDGPTLDELSGLGEAKVWALDLVADLADLKAGVIEPDDIDKGVLIAGPPGTGKTLFARALSRTAQIRWIETSFHAWMPDGDCNLGEVVKCMTDTFQDASQGWDDPCLLFIDEIDSLPSRGGTKRDNWFHSMLNAVLKEIDHATSHGVIVMGACNRPEQLDPALVRPGRLDRVITMPLPSCEDLIGIYRYHLCGDLKEIDLRTPALLSVGRTGAEVEQIVRDTRRRARRGKRPPTVDDLIAVITADGAVVAAEVLSRIAIHEAGHAAAATLLNVGEEMSLVLNSKSVSAFTSRLRASLLTREDFGRRIVIHLAGRAAEEVILGSASSGAGGSEDSDLAQATRLAAAMVLGCALGPTENLFYYAPDERDAALVAHPELHGEVLAILKRCYADATALIALHCDRVGALADRLIEARALDDPVIKSILLPRRTIGALSVGSDAISIENSL